jgi:hypothetical protein
MNKPTEVQYRNWTPQDVVEKIFLEEMTPTRAWREYLGLPQQEMADRVGLPLAEYAEHEASEKLRKPIRVKIAAALGVAQELLDV